jgi:hypothetical protein
VTVKWRTMAKWVQVQQLLSCGPSDNSQGVWAFFDIFYSIRCAFTTLESSDEMMQRVTDGLIAISASKRGINRAIGRAQFIEDCRALNDMLRGILAVDVDTYFDPENGIDWMRNYGDVKVKTWDSIDLNAVGSFFMCVLTPTAQRSCLRSAGVLPACNFNAG